MANTTPDKFNKDFAFNWQRKSDNTIVRSWKEFADSMLSIPMAHQMATNYMILNGTKNKQMLKVMRPYQVYATQNVIESLKRVDFEFGMNKIGYIWNTTGSGKTITSIKTAWLASRMPKVDKVVFVVDRIALTKQTNENYKAYDPDTTEDTLGSVQNTNNTTDLSRKLKSKDNSIIVTSVQKLDTLVKRKSFQAPDKNIVFIVDEAHRSTGGNSFENIQKAFKKSAWVGYTGTPMFDETTNGLRTEDIFGPLLHANTIREAIADRNVLGFKVDFETTIDEKQMKEEYLPAFYRERYPKWTQEQIQEKISHLSQEDMDDAPELNTLYVDRTLKGAGLIQAYSRTNRIADMQEKPWGRVVNYRWPAQNEKLMNKALSVYANKNSAILSVDEQRESIQEDGIITKPFEDVFNEVKQVVGKLSSLTTEFQQLPPSEKQKDYMLDLLREYNRGMAKLKQYDPEEVDGEKVGFNYDNPDELVEKLGMTAEQEVMLTTVLTNELKSHIAKEKKIPLYQIELRMTHVKDVKVDYDYLTELVEQLLNQVHEGKNEEAIETQEKINQFANGLDDRNYANKIMNAAVAIVKGHFPPAGSDFKYPAKLSDSDQIIQQANNVSLDRMFLDFCVKWGITDIITSAQMRELFSRHRYGLQDLDDNGQIRDIIAQASSD